MPFRDRPNGRVALAVPVLGREDHWPSQCHTSERRDPQAGARVPYRLRKEVGRVTKRDVQPHRGLPVAGPESPPVDTPKGDSPLFAERKSGQSPDTAASPDGIAAVCHWLCQSLPTIDTSASEPGQSSGRSLLLAAILTLAASAAWAQEPWPSSTIPTPYGQPQTGPAPNSRSDTAGMPYLPTRARISPCCRRRGRAAR